MLDFIFYFQFSGGDTDKQAEANKAHQKLADKGGGSNDFTTLLAIFQKCSERYYSSFSLLLSSLRLFQS